MNIQVGLPLSPHKRSLTIPHNQHKDYYESVAAYCDGMSCGDWKDEPSKARAIDTDEIWEIHWFPNTPVGSICIAAPTLEEALEFANSMP